MMKWRSRCSGREPSGVWRHGTKAERTAAACALALVGVLVLLAVLNRDARPLAVVAVLVYSGVLWCLRSRVRRRGRQDRLLAEEAARGVEQMERWLATGPRA